MKPVLSLMGLLAVAGGSLAWFFGGETSPAVRFRTAEVFRDELVATIAATATVEPEELIDVGAQVAGIIQSFGPDPNQPGGVIDFGSRVEEGTVLAQIDDALYRARADRAAALVEQAQAEWQQAQADLQRAQAELLQFEARLDQASRDWNRMQRLKISQLISETAYDAARAEHEVAKANLLIGQAAIAQAEAAEKRAALALQAAEAEHREALRNLEYTTIRSPVKGVIIDRRVNVGQTVVASLNAPSLFLIATDLKRLQLWASVNEADIGRVYRGQEVVYTVDAFPGDVFRGEVQDIRLNASMIQNVVTYTVVIRTENLDGKLLPYLTANVQFLVAQRDDVLLVPNAALRWRPRPERIAPQYRDQEPTTRTGSNPAAAAASHDRQVVWVEDGAGFVRPVEIQVGVTDGEATEVLDGELSEGISVVIGEAVADQPDEASTPFAPKFIRRKPSTGT